MLALLPLSVLIACGGGSEADSSEPEVVPAERVAHVRSLEVQPEEVTDLAILSADLLPLRRATLAAEVPGRVEQLTVDVGDRVGKGQILVRIDTRALRQQIAEAEALHVQAVDRFERAERLYEKRSITKEQHIDAVAGRDVAEARLKSAQLALAKSEVKAPWSGSVAAKRVEVGDYASPGLPLVELVAVNRLKVRAAASAADVPYLSIGEPVTVRVDVFPGEEWQGKVVRLGAELDSDTRTLVVEAEIDNSEGRLRPGLFGRLEVPRRVLPEAMLVPLASVVDYESEKILYVVSDGIAQRRSVVLGPTVGQRVVITTGLEPGDHVVVGGQQQVADGQKVIEAEEG
jgi:membrane fusion protein (multidrug efflux system)